MQVSLSWIEWLDRLDRVLGGARQDLNALMRWTSPKALVAIERSRRQLTALTNDLRLLDRAVLPHTVDASSADRADNLQKALDTAVFRLGTAADAQAGTPHAARERLLAAIDAALRDSYYEAAVLLGPSRRRA